MNKISGVILCGGKSRRMAEDKAMLEIAGKTMLERTVDQMRKVSDDIIIASNSLDKYGVADTNEVEDSYLGRGPLGGIHAALKSAKYKYSFVVAGDIPYFNAKLVELFLPFMDKGYDLIMPEFAGYRQPLLALYSKNCLSTIEEMALLDNYSIKPLSDKVHTLVIEEKTLCQKGFGNKDFFNMNTPFDLSIARSNKFKL